MEILPVKTTILRPRIGDFFEWLDASVKVLAERDVLLVSSKVVAIGEDRVVPIGEVDKSKLVEREADMIIPRHRGMRPTTVKQHTFIGNAGIDESNGDGYYILLPKDPSASAERIHAHLTKRFGLKELAVIVTDSRSQPFRYGATGVALGWYGLVPLISHIGKLDLFDRPFIAERTNLVDGLAAAANLVVGETNESTPIAIVRGIPNLTFTLGNTDHQIFADPEIDNFRTIYERWLP